MQYVGEAAGDAGESSDGVSEELFGGGFEVKRECRAAYCSSICE